MTSPSIVKSCNLLIESHAFLPAAIEIGPSKTLRIYIATSFDNFSSVYQAVCAKVDAIFSASAVSNIFLEKLNPAHLDDEKLFKAPSLITEPPLRAIYTAMIGGRASPLPITPEEDYLFTFNFDLGLESMLSEEELLEKIQENWIPLDTSVTYPSPPPITRQYAMSISINPIIHLRKAMLSSLIGDLPFAISLDKIIDCLSRIIGSSIENIPHQNTDQPFSYPFASIAAGAACSETTPAAAGAASGGASAVSGSKRSFSAMSNSSKPIVSIKEAIESSASLFFKISEEKSLLDEDGITGAAKSAVSGSKSFSSDLSSSLTATAGSGASTSAEPSEDVALMRKIAAKKRAYETLVFFQKVLLKNIKRPLPIPFPLLQLTRKECLSIFTKNIPDIARSMLVGVLEAPNPNEASLIRMQLFINLLIMSQSGTDTNAFLELIDVIEQAISGLPDHAKAWARAKFVSMAFLSSNFSVFNHPYYDLEILEDDSIYLKSGIDSGSASKQTALMMQGTDKTAIPVTKEIYTQAVSTILQEMTRLATISPLISFSHVSQDAAWERRKHLLLSRKQDYTLPTAAGAASAEDPKEGLSQKRFRKDE